MILWRDYLNLLREDGVELAESENESLDDEGNREFTYSLVRFLDGRPIYMQIPPIDNPDHAVRPYLQRQIMNTLRLPPEKYHFGRL